MKKMVIIGAGSAMFTQGLVQDLIKNAGERPLDAVPCGY